MSTLQQRDLSTVDWSKYPEDMDYSTIATQLFGGTYPRDFLMDVMKHRGAWMEQQQRTKEAERILQRIHTNGAPGRGRRKSFSAGEFRDLLASHSE